MGIPIIKLGYLDGPLDRVYFPDRPTDVGEGAS